MPTRDENEFTRGASRGWKKSDESIYYDVCQMLQGSSTVDASDIEVEVNEGCVYLRGHVDSRDMKKQAECEVETVSGVVDVQNLLTIDGGGIYVQE